MQAKLLTLLRGSMLVALVLSLPCSTELTLWETELADLHPAINSPLGCLMAGAAGGRKERPAQPAQQRPEDQEQHQWSRTFLQQLLKVAQIDRN